MAGTMSLGNKPKKESTMDPASAGVQAGSNILTSIMKARAEAKRQQREQEFQNLQAGLAKQAAAGQTLSSGTQTAVANLMSGMGRTVR